MKNSVDLTAFQRIALYILMVFIFVVFDPANRVLWVTLFSVAPLANILLSRWLTKVDEMVRIGISFGLGYAVYLILKLIFRL